MITATNTSTGDTWTYSYNFRGLMTGAVETNSDDTVIAQVTYTYDALDNRIGMDENGTQTWTLYDGSTPVMDFSGSGSLEMRYLNGPTGQIVDAVLARESAGGTIAWYLPDRLGTIRDLINNSGSIIDHVDYSAFGTQLGESSPSNGDRMMGFAGMERDTVTGLNLAVYRVQDPGTGRWTSQDPLGFVGRDTNLERYLCNDPTNGCDARGLSDGLDQLPVWLVGLGNSSGSANEGRLIGQAIWYTFRGNWQPTFPRWNDQRRKGYYCFEWAYAFEDAFNLESSGQYFTAEVQSASTPPATPEGNGPVHFWLKITSKETGLSVYVDDGFYDGGYVHIGMPVPHGWDRGNPGDVQRSECHPPPANPGTPPSTPWYGYFNINGRGWPGISWF